eukprot:scaffold2685_cov101-Isochrysis_galbana.AAC.4
MGHSGAGSTRPNAASPEGAPAHVELAQVDVGPRLDDELLDLGRDIMRLGAEARRKIGPLKLCPHPAEDGAGAGVERPLIRVGATVVNQATLLPSNGAGDERRLQAAGQLVRIEG